MTIGLQTNVKTANKILPPNDLSKSQTTTCCSAAVQWPVIAIFLQNECKEIQHVAINICKTLQNVVWVYFFKIVKWLLVKIQILKMALRKSGFKNIVAKLVTDKTQPCAFCNRNVDDELLYGKLYAIGNIQCHYYCVVSKDYWNRL